MISMKNTANHLKAGIRKLGAAALSLYFAASLSPITRTQSTRGLTHMNDLPAHKQVEGIDVSVKALRDFKRGKFELTDVPLAYARARELNMWGRFPGKDSSEFVRENDLLEYVANNGRTYFDNWMWSITSTDLSSKRGKELVQTGQLYEAFWTVSVRASEKYMTDPSKGFDSVVLESIKELRPMETMVDRSLFDWSKYDFSKFFGLTMDQRLNKTYEPGKDRGESIVPGENIAYLFLHPEDAMDAFRKSGGRKTMYLFSGIVTEDPDTEVRLSALAELKKRIVRPKYLLEEIAAQAKANRIDPATLNVLVSACNDYEEKETPAIPTTQVMQQMPFKREEDAQGEEDKLLLEQIIDSYRNQRLAQSTRSSDRPAQDGFVFDFPSIAMWHRDVVAVYKNARKSPDYRNGHIAKQERTLDAVLSDGSFFDVLPQEFTLVGLGCSDNPYEKRMILEAQRRGKIVKRFIAVDVDKTAYANALDAVSTATGVDCDGYPAEITPETLQVIRDELSDNSPLVYVAEGVINFESKDQETTFYSGVLSAIGPDDRLVVAKPLHEPSESADAYVSSAPLGLALLKVAGLDASAFHIEGIVYDEANSQFVGTAVCKTRAQSSGLSFSAGDRIRYLHSSRRSMANLLEGKLESKDAKLLYMTADSRERGYEISVIQKSV